jgi:hypothetical protein
MYLQVDPRLPLLGVQDDLGVGIRHSQTHLLLGTPDRFVSQLVTVERETGVEVRHLESHTINLLHQRLGWRILCRSLLLLRYRFFRWSASE